ncbi:MAG: membrane protein insertase YidC [Gemmatimonadetes bacterium]|nr:membrane protein insertase YidC [Gemmatimonadota bacterium]
MDNLRFVIAIILMVAVVVVTNLLFPPAKPPRPAAVRDTTAQTGAAPTAHPPAGPAPATSPSAPAAAPAPRASATLAAAPVVTVESPLFRYGISTRGGALVSAELLRYPSFTRRGPVQLVPNDLGPLISYRLQVGAQTIDLSGLAFTASSPGPVELRPGGGPQVVRLAHQDSSFAIELAYTFDPDQYTVSVQGAVRGLPASQLLIDLGPTLAVNEANAAEDHRALAFVVNSTRDGISSVPLDKVKADRIEEGPLQWVAIKNKYFVVGALVAPAPEVPFGGLIARNAPIPHASFLTATLPIARDGSFALRYYIGPQEAKRLAAVGHDFQDVNPYGWSFLRPIIRPLAHIITWALTSLHEALHLGYGWVLILFGVLVRVVMWPLNARAMRSQLKNMELQPRLKEIQERYKNAPEKMQQEVMRLYKEEGFNPLGGCLPMLIPMPVLFTLYFVFQATIEFRGVPFLWLPDLSRPDPLYVLPVLLGASMLALQWLSLRSTPQPNAQMKMMTWFMPILWTVFFINFASGLNLYYVSLNVASLPQQLQLIRERQRRQVQRA